MGWRGLVLYAKILDRTLQLYDYGSCRSILRRPCIVRPCVEFLSCCTVPCRCSTSVQTVLMWSLRASANVCDPGKQDSCSRKNRFRHYRIRAGDQRRWSAQININTSNRNKHRNQTQQKKEQVPTSLTNAHERHEPRANIARVEREACTRNSHVLTRAECGVRGARATKSLASANRPRRRRSSGTFSR